MISRVKNSLARELRYFPWRHLLWNWTKNWDKEGNKFFDGRLTKPHLFSFISTLLWVEDRESKIVKAKHNHDTTVTKEISLKIFKQFRIPAKKSPDLGFSNTKAVSSAIQSILWITPAGHSSLPYYRFRNFRNSVTGIKIEIVLKIQYLQLQYGPGTPEDLSNRHFYYHHILLMICEFLPISISFLFQWKWRE